MNKESKILNKEQIQKKVNEFIENKESELIKKLKEGSNQELQEENKAITSYGASILLPAKFTDEEREEVYELLDIEIPNAINKCTIREVENFDKEKKERELYYDYIYTTKIKESYKEIIHTFIHRFEERSYNTQCMILHHMLKDKSLEEYFNFIILESCIEVCKHLSAKHDQKHK